MQYRELNTISIEDGICAFCGGLTHWVLLKPILWFAPLVSKNYSNWISADLKMLFEIGVRWFWYWVPNVIFQYLCISEHHFRVYEIKFRIFLLLFCLFYTKLTFRHNGARCWNAVPFWTISHRSMTISKALMLRKKSVLKHSNKFS